MEFDLSVYVKAAVTGVPLLFVTMGLVGAWGKLGLEGKQQLVSSLLTGLALGLLYMIAQTRPPTGDAWQVYVYWFANVIYGLGLGVFASLLYEINKDLIRKLIEKYLPAVQGTPLCQAASTATTLLKRSKEYWMATGRLRQLQKTGCYYSP